MRIPLEIAALRPVIAVLPIAHAPSDYMLELL